MYKVLFVLLLLILTQQQRKPPLPGGGPNSPFDPNDSDNLDNPNGPFNPGPYSPNNPSGIYRSSSTPPSNQQPLDSRQGLSSAPTGKGQKSKGDYSVEKDPKIPPQVSSKLNEAAAGKIVVKDAKSPGQSGGMDLEAASKKSSSQGSRGRALHPYCNWYVIHLNWPVLDCPQYGFWVYVRGPALVWIKIGGTFFNSWPIYPWWPGKWYWIKPPLAKCGCNKVTLYVWTCSHWFNWWVWKPWQNCMNYCVSSDRYWDYRRCRCTCRHRCCPWWSQAPTYPINNSCACQ